MKYLFIILLFCGSIQKIHAQGNMQWYEAITRLTYGSNSFAMLPIHGLKIHDDKSCTVSFYSFGGYAYTYTRNEFYDELDSPRHEFLTLARFSADGKLLWTFKVENAMGLGYYKPFTHFQVDSKGNTILAVKFEEIVVVGTDTIRTTRERYQGVAAYIISPEGHVITKKKLCEARRIELEAMTIDSSNNIYIAGKFFDYRSTWENNVISSQESPSYFIASYSSGLQRAWVQPFRTGWDTYGQIAAIVYNPIYEKLHVLITQGTYNTLSSCKYMSWVLNHQIWSINGEQLTSDSLAVCDDLMIGGDCAIDRYGNIMIVGRFRGTLQCGSQRIVSSKSSDPTYCDITNSFLLKCDHTGKVLSLAPFLHPTLHSLHTVKTMPNGDYYLAGQIRYKDRSINWLGSPYPSGFRRSFIGKYDYWGNLLSYREFNKNAPNSSSDDWDYLHIDVHPDGDVMVADDHTGKYDTIAVSPEPDYEKCSISLFRLSESQLNPTSYQHKSGWTFGFLSVEYNNITVYAEQPQYRTYHYEIYDALGKLAVQGSIADGKPMEKIPTEALASGAYYLRISNTIATQMTTFVVVR